MHLLGHNHTRPCDLASVSFGKLGYNTMLRGIESNAKELYVRHNHRKTDFPAVGRTPAGAQTSAY